MKIKKITVTGLFDKNSVIVLDLNSDLNIITGRNGSGKTTVMKLAWFIISGNLLLALREVDFRICEIETDLYSCTVIRTGPVDCRVEMLIDGKRQILEDDEGDPQEHPFYETAEEKANPILMSKGSSIFFPTFRRIEGGFSTLLNRANRSRGGPRQMNEIDDALSTLSRKLTNHSHIFVSAISTQDIASLLIARHADFSETISNYQAEVSKGVIEKIKNYQKGEGVKQDADTVLSETRNDIEKIETFRDETMKPLEAVREIVKGIFQHSGISFDKRLSFGDAAAAVSSEVLSAGEKQMLSFICYNAFYKDAVIFIDEPELSLHVDWQRKLYQILSDQGSQNQFIFATHSPFIYGKYPDKEVSISADRGE